MNARDIIKLAAQLYVYDALKKKITILTNIQFYRRNEATVFQLQRLSIQFIPR